MVLGCSSDAGKSLLATALCRRFARLGVRVAPFKAQNMSNNARVVGPAAGAPGGEIGVAQWLQARAAGVDPDVRMNPVLVKPEADTRSQVVVRGAVDRALGARPWEERHDDLWAPMAASFDSLAAEFDLIVLEGAGSPAEINLRDQVNNRMIEHADATGLLVADIDRGGAFAHLHGTWALVPESTRARLDAFVLNRFRGDAALLEPGPSRLAELTGMADAGVLPMLRHQLPREEGAAEAPSAPAGAPRVVLPRFPHGSNLDEFHLLSTVADVRWATGPGELRSLDPARDLVVVPGSKHVVADLDWLRAVGLDGAIVDAARRGVRVLGVCGGAMALGARIVDPIGVEGDGPSERLGLGLLDVVTTMAGSKRVATTRLDLAAESATGGAPGLGERWSALAGCVVEGYEIRYGDVGGRRVIAEGAVLATTVHGLLEDADVVERVLGVRPRPVLDETFDLLADAVDEHLDTALLDRLVGERP